MLSPAILVLNSGSSSIKFSVFRTSSDADPTSILEGELTNIGTAQASLTVAGKPIAHAAAQDLNRSVDTILNTIAGAVSDPISAIGFRVVHPGPNLHDHCLITLEVLTELDHAIAFAPLHDPSVLTVIRECQSRFPALPHYACFDTVFHRTLPPEASTYAIPERYRALGVRRYGFHGLSCESILAQLHPIPRRLVIAHLGSGCSVTAVLDGRSVDTSMGLTPTGGVVMGTRPGDLDPGLLLYLLRQQTGDGVATLERELNHTSGLVALSGQANDLKAVRKAASSGDAPAILALKVFTRGITKAIGSYAWLLGGLDLLVFTGGIGEHDAQTRTEVLAKSPPGPVQVLPAQENLTISRHVARMMQAG